MEQTFKQVFSERLDYLWRLLCGAGCCFCYAKLLGCFLLPMPRAVLWNEVLIAFMITSLMAMLGLVFIFVVVTFDFIIRLTIMNTRLCFAILNEAFATPRRLPGFSDPHQPAYRRAPVRTTPPLAHSGPMRLYARAVCWLAHRVVTSLTLTPLLRVSKLFLQLLTVLLLSGLSMGMLPCGLVAVPVWRCQRLVKERRVVSRHPRRRSIPSALRGSRRT